MANATFIEIHKHMRKLVHDLNPQMPQSVVGAEYPTNVEEFVRYSSLLNHPHPSRTVDLNNRFYCEIACYAKHAIDRTDQSISRPYELADIYAKLVHQTNIMIESSCIRFLEARMIYLDLNSLGQNAAPFQQTSPKLNLHAVVIEAEAIISERKVL